MGSLPPHVYAIGERAYRHMVNGRKSQCVVCSGDSGAGKTETAKHLLRYLTTIASSGGRGEGEGEGEGEAGKREEGESVLEKRIIEANPIMEAFGNAKTLRNHNSSRFGKFVRVHFGSTSRVIGADITTYLLEKSRVTLQPNKERNFHIFYQVSLRSLSSSLSHPFQFLNPSLHHTLPSPSLLSLISSSLISPLSFSHIH